MGAPSAVLNYFYGAIIRIFTVSLVAIHFSVVMR